MSVIELKSRLDKNEIILIDVREPEEHKAESIKKAHLIPLGELSIDKLPSTSRPIVVHCRSGKRSQEACQQLIRQNAKLDIYSLEGGILAWQHAGFRVYQAGVPTLSLDQQTQCATGCLILFTVLLGALINPAFYVISAGVGLGLIYAGITGWCGMAKLLAKMPWNKCIRCK